MARKKRRHSFRSSPPPHEPEREPEREKPLNAPFQDLKAALKRASAEPSPTVPTPPAKATAKAEAERLRREAQRAREEAQRAREQAQQARIAAVRQVLQDQDDLEAFTTAMADVTPLNKDARGRVAKPPKPALLSAEPSEDEVSLKALQDLVAGRSAFTIEHTAEYVEGVAPGVDSHLAQRLHHGDFSIQDQLDLHGHTVDEAKETLDHFLTQSYLSGRRCLRLIHGRGLNSPDKQAVLKDAVHTWLSHGRLSRMVLAFVTARPNAGGAGAVYVLLRRVPPSR